MNKNTKRFMSVVTISGSAAILGALLMVGGCGGGGSSSPVVASNSSPLTSANATLNANGTVTTTAAINATTAGGTTAITIPSGTTITGSTPFTSLPAVNVSTPENGVSGMPQPLTAGFIISSTAGAEDITIGGSNSVTFSQPVTLTITIDPKKITNRTVNMNKNDGNGWKNIGTASILANVATFTTLNLCWFGVDNVYTPTSGSGGGTGGSGTGTSF